MIRSMTGFGKASRKSPYGKITVEVKTLNHKSLSVSCTPFNGFFLLEDKLNKICEKKIYRGKVFIRVSHERTEDQRPLRKIRIDDKAAREYKRKVARLAKDLKVPGELTIRDIIQFPGVVETAADDKEEKLWPHIKKALDEALDKLVAYRKTEGSRLAKDLRQRTASIKRRLREIKRYEKRSVNDYRARLVSALKESVADAAPDKTRLETEVALFARNCDIAEEVTRLGGHLVAYEDAVKKAKKDIGKKLDFIAQEMHREINTIGSKSSDFRISKAVIEVKSEIEKIREQLRNVE